MKVKDIMTPNVEYTDPSTTIKEAAQKMKSRDFGALPIGENDRLVGMLTDRDITVRSVAEGKDPEKTTVREAMSEHITYIYDDQDLTELADLMKKEQIRRVVVLNRDKRMVGIASLGDLTVDGENVGLGGEVLKKVSQPTKND
jgi:CBS domain-containing protein